MNTRRVATFALLACLMAVSTWSTQAAQDPQTKQPPRASLGVLVEPTPPNALHPGVMVREVPADSPAAKAGIMAGDIIMKAGTKDVKDFDMLANSLAQHKPGDKVTFQVMRNGEKKDLTVTLGERSERRSFFRDSPGSRSMAYLGVQIHAITPETRERFKLTRDSGLVIAEVVRNTPADRAGLKAGDVVLSIDGKNITDPMQFRAAIQEAGAGKEVTLKVMRGNETKEIRAKLEEPPADLFFRELPGLPSGLNPREWPMPTHEEMRKIEQQVERLQHERKSDHERVAKCPH